MGHSKRLVILAAFAVIFPALALAQAGSKATPKAKSASAKAAPAKTTPAAASNKEPVKTAGSRTAPVTMEVFSDFQCPACRSLFFEAIKPMMDDYVHTGKVFLIHRDNPLAMHPYARDAARYANAAAQIGKFEKVAEAIYAAQPYWSVDRSKLEQAVASALTPAEFGQVRASLASSAVETSIEKDLTLGKAVPVSSTPTVVLTHRGQRFPLPGNPTYALLKRVLDQMLSQR